MNLTLDLWAKITSCQILDSPQLVLGSPAVPPSQSQVVAQMCFQLDPNVPICSTDAIYQPPIPPPSPSGPGSEEGSALKGLQFGLTSGLFALTPNIVAGR